MKRERAEGHADSDLIKPDKGEAGFTLIEAAIALVILLVATMAVAGLFVYAIKYNQGANDRALALAIAQQKMEQLRRTPFDSLTTPPQPEDDIVMSGRSYGIQTTIDGSTTLKRITIQVTPRAAGASWTRSSVLVVSQRTDTGIGTYFP